MNKSPVPPLYAARLNAFKIGLDRNCGLAALIERAGTVPGLGAADLNFPDHFVADQPAEVASLLASHGLVLNGLAMRYYSRPEFRLGALAHPSGKIRRDAIDLTKKGLDALAEMDGRLMTLWLGQDGFDYAFQTDYGRAWDQLTAALAELADHNDQIDISIEYKPNEPRAYALLPDLGATLLALAGLRRPNMGVTIDFAHALYADEMPAQSALLAARHSRLLGVHLNDGYGKRDDGLMVGSVHPIQTVELLVALQQIGYRGVLYFDTFPDQGGLDPVAECRANIEITERLRQIAARLADDAALAGAIARQDAGESQRIVAAALFGQGG